MARPILPTLHLLGSSVVVAVSGSLRLHIAFLCTGIPAAVPIYCSAGLIIYAIYTIDRATGSKEDTVNKGELSGSNRKAGIAIALFVFVIGTLILAQEKIIVAPFVPFLIGGLYSYGIRLHGRRFSLKGGAGMKNLVIGMTWGGTMGLIVAGRGSISSALAILMFYGIKLFCNSVIYDMKDIRGDREAGIITIPARYGIRNAKKLILIALSGLHGTMAILFLRGLLCPEWTILSYSLLSGLAVIAWYDPERELAGNRAHRYIREFFIDGESLTALILRSVVSW